MNSIAERSVYDVFTPTSNPLYRVFMLANFHGTQSIEKSVTIELDSQQLADIIKNILVQASSQMAKKT